ncbi:hypothetical protein AB0M35_06205 [Micromonospora sp. NPDC051196]|uniref:hypothetical protein n=1 Tax=Micromonospora sp. NPDC051196 TaxID=3155281 RepID=UPI00343F0FE0
MDELPPEVSNDGLREAQRALDRDLRLAMERNRADRRPGRGLPGDVPSLSNIKIRKARDDAADLVNKRLGAGRIGLLRIAWNRLLRLFRRREVSESVRKPQLTSADQVGNRQAYHPQAASSYGPGPRPGEPTREGPQPVTAGQVGNWGQTQPSSSPEPGARPGEPTRKGRQPITAEQIDSWQRTLKSEGLQEHDRHNLELALSAAYYVTRYRDLQKLYEDPGQLPDIADAVASADWVVDRYDPGRQARQASPVYTDEQQEAMLPSALGGHESPTWTEADEQETMSHAAGPASLEQQEFMLPAAWDGYATSAPMYADEQQMPMTPTAWGGHTMGGAEVYEQQPPTPPTPQPAVRHTPSERPLHGSSYAAHLTSLRPVPRRPAGSPIPESPTPHTSRPNRTAGQGRARG